MKETVSAWLAAAAPHLPAPANALASGSLLAIGVGCWWERPSLGLIVPATIVLTCLIWGRLRGGQ